MSGPMACVLQDQIWSVPVVFIVRRVIKPSFLALLLLSLVLSYRGRVCSPGDTGVGGTYIYIQYIPMVGAFVAYSLELRVLTPRTSFSLPMTHIGHLRGSEYMVSHLLRLNSIVRDDSAHPCGLVETE